MAGMVKMGRKSTSDHGKSGMRIGMKGKKRMGMTKKRRVREGRGRSGAGRGGQGKITREVSQ